MSAAAPTLLAAPFDRRPIPAAVCELLAYCAVIAAASLAFVAGWLSVNAAVVLTVVLLAGLIVLSWVHFGKGRHPVFLFLCTLMFFQGGRLLAFCLGVDPDPLKVQMMAPNPFVLARDEQGVVLLCLALSALGVYAPCRWAYRAIPAPDSTIAQKYLPYLYVLFALSLPVQLLKNYRYFQYVQQHGGYNSIFINHAAQAASIPFLVRVIPLISLPVFVAIFVIERRRSLVYVVTALYFSTASIIVLLGSRMSTFLLVLALFYVSRVKSRRKAPVVRILLLAFALLLIGDAVRQLREAPDKRISVAVSPVRALALQGASIDVTAIAVKYTSHFRPYAFIYLLRELQDAFVPNDAAHYYRGEALGFDMTVLLDPAMFIQGFGVAGSYIAEAYIIGGLAAVALVSLLIGFGLNILQRLSAGAFTLFFVALVLPDVLFMPRGALLDWLSILMKNAVSVILLWFGWKAYCLLASIRRAPFAVSSSGGATGQP